MKVTIEIDVEPERLDALVRAINGIAKHDVGTNTIVPRELKPPRLLPQKSSRRRTTDKEAKLIILDIIQGIDINSIGARYARSHKVIRDILTGVSFLRISGFEPLENRDPKDVENVRYLNRTSIGKPNSRAKELTSFYAELHEENKKKVTEARLAKQRRR